MIRQHPFDENAISLHIYLYTEIVWWNEIQLKTARARRCLGNWTWSINVVNPVAPKPSKHGSSFVSSSALCILWCIEIRSSSFAIWRAHVLCLESFPRLTRRCGSQRTTVATPKCGAPALVGVASNRITHQFGIYECHFGWRNLKNPYHRGI